jgi:hypothetical protein
LETIIIRHASKESPIEIVLLQTVTTRPGEILVGPVETEFQVRVGFR